MKEEVILVNERDEVVGTMEKMEAHTKALLHRAFSIFIFTPDGKWWLHRRAKSKYHSGGLWTNACCGHPRPGEDTLSAAKRRLKEECGLTTELKEQFSFLYKLPVGNELTEYEFDHVFFGVTEQHPELNSEEAEAWKCLSSDEIRTMQKEAPDTFTPWFNQCFSRVLSLKQA